MYFVAILCPPQLDKKVKHFKEWMRDNYGCRVALRSPAHITLVPPFWFDHDKEEYLLSDFMQFHSDADPIEIRLQGFSHFSNRVIFIKVNADDSLNILQTQSANYFMQYQKEKISGNKPFTPHVTIANRDLRPGDFIKAWERFSKLSFDESFVVSRISLLRLETDGWVAIKDNSWK